MQVVETEARKMLQDMGINAKDSKGKPWAPAKLAARLNRLPELLEEAKEPEGESLTLLKRITEAIKEGEEIVLDTGEVETESNGAPSESNGESPKKKGKKVKKTKEKGARAKNKKEKSEEKSGKAGKASKTRVDLKPLYDIPVPAYSPKFAEGKKVDKIYQAALTGNVEEVKKIKTSPDSSYAPNVRIHEYKTALVKAMKAK